MVHLAISLPDADPMLDEVLGLTDESQESEESMGLRKKEMNEWVDSMMSHTLA
jgi:hypothetical protein